MMIPQLTLRNDITAKGVGLHTGEQIACTLKPAPENMGVIFRRIDLDPVVEITAKYTSVGDTSFNTCLMDKSGAKVLTVEHLMAAFSALGVDNVYVELTGEEVPIMDGSAAPFIFLIQAAGVIAQKAPKQFIKIKKTLSVEEEDKWAKIEPFEGFKVAIDIDFDHPLIRESRQSVTLDFANSSSFIREISRARTFGFKKHHQYLLANNLALGSSLDNTIALNDEGIMNEGGLRWGDEFVRHKLLDAVGDLFILGHPLIGAYSSYKSGHCLNSKLVKALCEDPSAWEIVTLPTGEDSEKIVSRFQASYVEAEEGC